LSFGYLQDWHVSVVNAAAIVGLFAFGIGIYSTASIAETHDKDLDFVEQ
jgi:hypothetical protein